MTVSLRYKEPGEDESKLLEYTIGSGDVTDTPSSDWLFTAAVCQFAMLLHDSEYKGTTTIGSVLELLESLDLKDDPYKAEFAGLVKALA